MAHITGDWLEARGFTYKAYQPAYGSPKVDYWQQLDTVVKDVDLAPVVIQQGKRVAPAYGRSPDTLFLSRLWVLFYGAPLRVVGKCICEEKVTALPVVKVERVDNPKCVLHHPPEPSLEEKLVALDYLMEGDFAPEADAIRKDLEALGNIRKALDEDWGLNTPRTMRSLIRQLHSIGITTNALEGYRLSPMSVAGVVRADNYPIAVGGPVVLSPITEDPKPRIRCVHCGLIALEENARPIGPCMNRLDEDGNLDRLPHEWTTYPIRRVRCSNCGLVGPEASTSTAPACSGGAYHEWKTYVGPNRREGHI